MTENSTISPKAVQRRQFWITEIQKLSGNFGADATRLEKELEEEIKHEDITALVDHLRLCGNIPEIYEHDSSEEKLYSKYTDCLLALAYRSLGMQSIVLRERADAADVETFSSSFSFVADAKSFRLSRTAKNQKDFKIEAMAGWKRGKPYAMVVCPIYQLPGRKSQIYRQATTRNVCIFTYSHLAVLINYAVTAGKTKATTLLEQVFKTIAALNPSDIANDYWLAINQVMLSFAEEIGLLWAQEKAIANHSIILGKEEALGFLAQEREKIMQMSREEAIAELMKVHQIERRIATIQAVSDNGLFNIK